MIDFYSKTMLSVIALALTALAAQNFTRTADANNHDFHCFDPRNPCLIKVVGFDLQNGLPVEVQNFPSVTRAYLTGQENPLKVEIIKE